MAENVIPVVLYMANACDIGFISHTSYGLCGRGHSFDEAEKSAMSVVTNHLGACVQNARPLPDPDYRSADEMFAKLREEDVLPAGIKLEKSHTTSQEPRHGLPKLVFEFYVA
ncbi:hypothetical protein ACFL96_07550 [Thermoproteota archaeon]